MNDTQANLGELTFTRTYNAPRELVFECMITPEHLAHFWGPVGVTHTGREHHGRPRSRAAHSRPIMVNDETAPSTRCKAVYVEIVEPERSSSSPSRDVEGGMTTSITFTDLGDGRTEVIIHQTNVPEMYLTAEAQAGMQSSFDRFAAYVSSL